MKYIYLIWLIFSPAFASVIQFSNDTKTDLDFSVTVGEQTVDYRNLRFRLIIFPYGKSPSTHKEILKYLDSPFSSNRTFLGENDFPKEKTSNVFQSVNLNTWSPIWYDRPGIDLNNATGVVIVSASNYVDDHLFHLRNVIAFFPIYPTLEVLKETELRLQIRDLRSEFDGNYTLEFALQKIIPVDENTEYLETLQEGIASTDGYECTADPDLQEWLFKQNLQASKNSVHKNHD